MLLPTRQGSLKVVFCAWLHSFLLFLKLLPTWAELRVGGGTGQTFVIWANDTPGKTSYSLNWSVLQWNELLPVGKCIWGENRSVNKVTLQTRWLSSAFLPATLPFTRFFLCRGSLLPYSVPSFLLFPVSLHWFLKSSPCSAYLLSSELPPPSKSLSTQVLTQQLCLPYALLDP